MPRVETSKVSSGAGTRSPYHAAYDSANAASMSTSPSCSSSSGSSAVVSPPPRPASASPSSSTSSPLKKKHVCPTCERGFTTSGHLARHVRIHTGERNHACPFPGCETRCSRQDNLQQHYRIHLSPGSRRATGRSGARRRVRAVMPPPSSSSSSSSSYHSDSKSSSPSTSVTPAPEHLLPGSPPPLAQATLYHDRTNSLLDSPPPLSNAVYSSVPPTAQSSRQHSPSGRHSPSPEPNYDSPSMMPNPASNGLAPQYSTNLATYRQLNPVYANDQGQASPYGYADPANGVSYSPGRLPPLRFVNELASSSYSPFDSPNAALFFSPLDLAHLSPTSSDPLPAIRHSLRRVYYEPSVPASSHHSLATSSLNSGPSTPTFPMYGASYTAQSTLADINSTSATSNNNSYFNQGPHVVTSNGYTMSISTPLSADSTLSRFPSPPPVLAPIHSHYSAPTISMGQAGAYADSVSQVYEYERQTFGIKQGYDLKGELGYGRQEGYGGYRDMAAMGHSAWKGRGVGALVG
ncbi:hypothetical protein FA13DRAFT_1804441 [Coprinellus micaceus]|uniref:C2H2-type domain-containing protein n=1 Tax=Coprinellus micaceus TaxID=71717 RepID=A0A4Y7S7M2_COPMI|nr:hypothetical protein FA13DRAFT_1804441 [Coprinellus micaceus]